MERVFSRPVPFEDGTNVQFGTKEHKDIIMNQLFTLVFGLVLTLSLVSSASAQTDALSANHWSLVEMNGEAVANSRASVEFSTDRKNVSGNAGCNRFFGGVRVSRGTMRFSGLGSTRMFCDGAMDAETAFLDTLKSVTRYRISDNVLTLLAGRTAVLKFAGSPKPEEAGESGSSASISERKWVLETAGGDPVASTDGSAFITLMLMKNVQAATQDAMFLAAVLLLLVER